jgi:hypothetical protein
MGKLLERSPCWLAIYFWPFPSATCIRRLEFKITYKKNSNSVVRETEFYISQNTNAIGEAKINPPLSQDVHTITFEKLITLSAYQYYGLGIPKRIFGPSSLSSTISKRQTNLSMEKI